MSRQLSDTLSPDERCAAVLRRVARLMLAADPKAKARFYGGAVPWRKLLRPGEERGGVVQAYVLERRPLIFRLGLGAHELSVVEGELAEGALWLEIAALRALNGRPPEEPSMPIAISTDHGYRWSAAALDAMRDANKAHGLERIVISLDAYRARKVQA